MKKVNYIIMPMAGIGKRFKDAQYNTIKPLVLVDNETILEKSLKYLPKSEEKYLVLNKKIFERKRILRKILEDHKFEKILLEKKTLGQADTVNKLKDKLKSKSNKSCLVHSCDHILKYNFSEFDKISKNNDVIIFVTKLKSKIIKNYNSFAYCKINENNLVSKIVEKKTISKKPQNDFAVVGTFWFKNLSDCFLSQDIALKKKSKVNEEYYVGNNINHLIKLGKKVKVLEVETWINLGDIFSYTEYIYWKNFFNKNLDLKHC